MEMLALSTLLLIGDWGQTRYIATTPGYYETNPMLGRKPTLNRVNTHFGIAIFANAGVGFVLPEKYRSYWWGTVSMLELGYVGNNYSIGVGVKW